MYDWIGLFYLIITDIFNKDTPDIIKAEELKNSFINDIDLPSSTRNFKNAILSGANLSKCNLSNANLKHAILSGANLEGAILNNILTEKILLKQNNKYIY